MAEQMFGPLAGVPNLEEIILIYDNDEVYSWKTEEVEDIKGLTHYVATELTAFHGIYGGEIRKIMPLVPPSAAELAEQVIEPFLASHDWKWSSEELAQELVAFLNRHIKEE